MNQDLVVGLQMAPSALPEAEVSYRWLAEHAADWNYWLDARRCFKYMSPACLRISAYPPEDFLADPDLMLNIVHPDDRARYRACFEAIERPEQDELEFRILRRDGEVRWIDCISQTLHDEAGNYLGQRASLRDISRRKAGEEQLRKLSLAVEQSPESIIITDLGARIEYVNGAFCKTSGYSFQEVLGQNSRLLRSGLTPAAIYVQMWQALKRGEVWQGDLTNRRKNGETYIETVRVSPIRQADGRITHYLAIKQDVTAHRLALDELRKSRALLQRVIDATPDLVFVKDREHRFILVNERFAKTFNQAPEAMIGHLDTEFLPLDLCHGNPAKGVLGFHDYDDAVFEGHSIHLPEERLSFANGETRIFDTFKAPLRDATQNIYGNFCYRRDVTERFHKEQEQVLLERQLRQAQKMELIGHMTGGIAHDFNNILASMFGYAELIRMSEGIQGNQQLSLYLQEILQAGIRAKELVAQLLTFSGKKETANEEPIGVAPIVAEVAKLLRSTVPASIPIHIFIAKGLPKVLISPVQLHQVLMNLGVNARDAMGDKGAINIRVEQVFLDGVKACSSCHIHFSGKHLVISVADTGSGISPPHLLKIFDPFFTTKEFGRGSGLGLSVLHGIVHSANGHIEVLSCLGQGTEFRIYLPAQAGRAGHLARHVRPDTLHGAVCGRVMVVDDDASIVGCTGALLESLGCEVIGLTSATEALRVFQDNPYGVDMVLTDQSMPDLTGAELACAMLARRPGMPIVLSTGYSNALNEDTARRIGIRCFLVKPVPAKVLADVVIECLAGKI